MSEKSRKESQSETVDSTDWIGTRVSVTFDPSPLTHNFIWNSEISRVQSCIKLPGYPRHHLLLHCALPPWQIDQIGWMTEATVAIWNLMPWFRSTSAWPAAIGATASCDFWLSAPAETNDFKMTRLQFLVWSVMCLCKTWNNSERWVYCYLF